MATIRQARVGEMVKRELALIIQREMRDPRLALVSVNGVEVARDFTVAKVFISVLGTPEDKAHALKALQNASGVLRGYLGKAIDLRTVPVLQFRHDEGVERGIHMFALLNEEQKTLAAMSADAALYEAENAEPTPAEPHVDTIREGRINDEKMSKGQMSDEKGRD